MDGAAIRLRDGDYVDPRRSALNFRRYKHGPVRSAYVEIAPKPTFTSTMVVRVPWGEYVLRPRK